MRNSPQVELIRHLVLRPAGAPLAQVGLQEQHFVGGPFGAGVDGEGVGVVVEKPRIPCAGAGARDGEVRALAAPQVGVELAIRHQVFERCLVPADADPKGAPIKTPRASEVESKRPGERGGLGEVIGHRRGVVGLSAVKRERDVPIVGVRPPRFRAGELADRPQRGDEVFANFDRRDDRCEEASHGPHATLDNHV
mgnify:CR=1 FL=1